MLEKKDKHYIEKEKYENYKQLIRNLRRGKVEKITIKETNHNLRNK